MTTNLDRLLREVLREPPKKAVSGGAWMSAIQQGPLLSSLYDTWHARAAAYLRAYKVGWFYKAESRISADFGNLEWTLAYEDAEGDNEEDIVAAPGNVPFDRLTPLEQFLRLSERPNPSQTGRAFKQQQMIRLDMTGRAVVYIEKANAGLPTALYGISPDRMHQSRAKDGRLLGWVMDPNAPSGGVPFDAAEIMAVEYPGADIDPQGVVEAVYQYAQLAPMIPQHTADVLSTGGRLAGMAWPKERSLSEDEFADAQRAWRSVTSDPNAARRLLLFPEPMEYQSGAATPEQIGLPELASLSRDEILTAFPIAPEMLMVPMATGLNSGQTQAAVEARYWSGTMHPRVETWEDTLQQALIPLYENAVGRPLDFDIEEPDLDDALALTDKVEALKGLIAIGFDPKESVSAVGLDGIKWNGVPEPPPVPEPVDPNQPDPNQPPAPAPTPAPAPPTKALTIKARREQVIGEELPGFRTTMQTFLADQKDRLADEVTRVLGPMTKSARKALPDDWWDQAREDAYLRDALRGLYVRLARTGLQTVADDVGKFVYLDRVKRVTEKMLDTAGARIAGINETTRKAVAEAVEEGVRRGYSIGQITNGFTGEAESFRGLKELPAFDGARAELVARTETMLAYNESALRGYQEFGIERVEIFDGDEDPECEDRLAKYPDGIWPIEEALAEQDHPNGTLDWAPVDDGKAVRDVDRMYEVAMKALELVERPQPQPNITITNQPPAVQVDAPITVTTPEQPAPVVNVTLPDQQAPVVNITNIPPDVTVEPASVVVNVPDVHVDAPIVNVTVPEQAPAVVNVTLPEPKPTKRTVERDERGQIVSITDG